MDVAVLWDGCQPGIRYPESMITNHSTIRMNAPRAQCLHLDACWCNRIHGYSAIHAAQNATEPATFGETPNLRTAQLAISAPIPATTPAMARSARSANVWFPA